MTHQPSRVGTPFLASAAERKFMIEHLLRAVRDLDDHPEDSAQAAMAAAQYLCAADWLERNGLTRLHIIRLSGINPEDYTIKGPASCATTSTPR